MTRTIGDHNTRTIGVIGKPEIYKEHNIEYLDYSIVLGSDGLFEYLSNQRIADIMWRERMKTSQEISSILMQEAKSKWKIRGSSIDDIT